MTSKGSMSTPVTTLAVREEDWVQRLRKNYAGTEQCGFGVYYHPALLVEIRLGMARARIEFQLARVINRLGLYSPAILLQPLQWPTDLKYDTEVLARELAQYAPPGPSAYDDCNYEDDGCDEEAEEGADYGDIGDLVYFDYGIAPTWFRYIKRQCRVPPETNAYPQSDSYDDEALWDRDANADLKKLFAGLRSDFKALRELQRKPSADIAHLIRYGCYESLLKGLLDRVFVVVDPYSAFSWWDIESSKESWVWIVDPSFDDEGLVETTNGLTARYQGYLRVHLRQLWDKFFRIMLFHPEISLEQLWEAARHNDLRAFTSLDSHDRQTLEKPVALREAPGA